MGQSGSLAWQEHIRAIFGLRADLFYEVVLVISLSQLHWQCLR